MKDFLKSNISDILYYSPLGIIVISVLFGLSDVFMGYFLVGMMLVLFATLYYMSLVKSNIQNKFGEILFSYNRPTPFTTMLSSILKTGYKIEDIRHIDFMSFDLNQSCTYLNGILPAILKKNTILTISFVGYGDATKCDVFENSSLSFHFTKEKLFEHKNIITMQDGRSFLWYEPNHKIIDGKHYFINGGYFIEPKYDVLKQINKEIENYKKVA